MKAVQAVRFGSPDVLVYKEVPDLQPGPNQVLIKVESVAVNYSDIMRRSNTPYPFPTSLPYIPGGEVAGEVVAVGDNVTELPLGSRVFALAGDDGAGGYAEYALANANQTVPIPPTLTTDEACAIVVAGATAILILKEVAHLQAGESVLIEGASGGVGSYAIQIAKLLGAGNIIASASSLEKLQAARNLGADHVVDYTQPDWSERVREFTENRGVDVVLEMNGGAVFAQSLDCLAPFGRAVVYGMASLQPLFFDPETVIKFFYNPALNQSLHVFNLGLWFGLQPQKATQALQELINLVASGQIKVQIGLTLPLSQAAEAHQLIEQRRTSGKVILKPWQA